MKQKVLQKNQPMSGEPPFQAKSTKTPRSPVRSSSNPREPSLIREDRTRKQVQKLAATKTKNKSESDTKETERTERNTTDGTSKKVTNITQATEVAQQYATQANITKPQKKMDTQQIQQQIASFVPEFSGDEGDSAKISHALTKFTGTADIIYNRLKSEEEKEYFGEIIKYRLTGNAFNTIDRQQVKE